jgi:predicted N-acetyltransferase YhbS
MSITIRRETPNDYIKVEEVTREAFWNMRHPGCDEHYLVNSMRSHPDFISELDYVLEADGEVIGSIMYTMAKLHSEEGHTLDILTFGPLSIHPKYQRKGFGKHLMEYSMARAKELAYPAIVIYGNPNNYLGAGFKSAHRFGISSMDGTFPAAMLAVVFDQGKLRNGKWKYVESSVYEVDKIKAELFDRSFEPKQKEYAISQEVFYILSKSRITG